MTDEHGGDADGVGPIESDHEFDHDVVVVGGGPAGCSAGVFTARYDLDTVIFDRGRSSIQRCAHIENYLGFPGGVDVETFYGLIHDHAAAAGCTVEDDLVETVERVDDGGFRVEPQSGHPVTARRVIAATRYGAGEYLRGLDDEDAMFVTHDHGGEEDEHFDEEYADPDGTTPIPGLYVASPYSGTSAQAIMAAGHGARVGVTVVEAVQRERGYPEVLADYYDWVRREAELSGEWADRDRWREYLDEQIPDDHDVDEERLTELRERAIDRRFDAYITEEEASRRAEAGQRRLLDQIDDELVLEAASEIEAAGEAGDGAGVGADDGGE